MAWRADRVGCAMCNLSAAMAIPIPSGSRRCGSNRCDLVAAMMPNTHARATNSWGDGGPTIAVC
jgi:hypothetical protein